MNWQDSVIFKLVIELIGNYICALLVEKGVSLLQGRKFQNRYAFAIFLIILALTAIVRGIFLH